MTRRRGEQRAERYLFDPPATTLAVVADAPVEVAVLELSVIDEAPAFPFEVYHRNGYPEHECHPNVRAQCVGCGRKVVLCVFDPADRSQIAHRRPWRCGSCSEVS